jgi:hypothetical protein
MPCNIGIEEYVRFARADRFRYVGAMRVLIGTIIAALALLGCEAAVPLPPAEADAARSERQAQAFVEA